MRACEHATCSAPAVRTVELLHLRAPETRHVCLAHARAFDDAGGADATRPLLAPSSAPYDRPDRVLGVAAVAVRTALASGPKSEREVRAALLRPLSPSVVRRALDELVDAGVALVEGSRWALARHAEQLAAPPARPVRPNPAPLAHELDDEPEESAMADTLSDRILQVLKPEEWVTSGALADRMGEYPASVSSMLRRMAERKVLVRAGEACRGVAGGGYLYGLAGNAPPAVEAKPPASRPASPGDQFPGVTSTVVIDRLLEQTPWSTARELNVRSGRTLDALLSKRAGEGTLLREARDEDGVFTYARLGAEPSAPPAELLTAKGPVVSESWVEALVDMPLAPLADDFVEHMADEGWHPGPAMLESPEWGVADPPADVPALPSVLEADRLRAELRETESEVDELLAALGAAPVEGDLADKLEALHEGIGGGREALREAKADHHSAVVEAARAKAEADRLVGERDLFGKALLEIAGHLGVDVGPGLTPADLVSRTRLAAADSSTNSTAFAEEVGDVLAKNGSPKPAQGEPYTLDRLERVLDVRAADYNALVLLRSRLREVLATGEHATDAQLIEAAEQLVIDVAAVGRARPPHLRPLASVRVRVDSVGGVNDEPEVELGIGDNLFSIPVSLWEMRAVAAHLWGDVLVSIFPAPTPRQIPDADGGL